MPRPRHPQTSRRTAEALARAAPLVSRWIERVLASHDPPLTVAQYLALRAIAEGGLVGAELARRASVSPAAVSQLLAALEAGGLVERRPAAGDRRRQALALGAAGRETLASAQRLLQEQLAPLLADLPHPEVDALGRLLARLETTLSGAAPPPRPRPRKPPPRGPQ
jgi:DNA-binding MarR family transcriptional regulator